MLHTVISESSNGNPEPRIEVEATGKTGRWLDAVLHLIAAHVELITPKKSPWVVNIAHGSGSFGWVALELATCSPAEVMQAVTVLDATIAEEAKLFAALRVLES